MQLFFKFAIVVSIGFGLRGYSKADEAINKSLKLIAKSAHTYTKNRKCFTCHHQALPAMTMALAKKKGWEIDAASATTQRKFTHHYFEARRKAVAAGKGVPGGAYNTGYALISLSRAKHPADKTTDAMVSYLYQKQKKDGHWPIRTHRPPLEDSDFTATALSIRAVQLYARKDHKKDLAERVSRARAWLLKSEKLARTQEDQIFRLFGLSWSQADTKSIQAAADILLKRQQKDGGWKQLIKSKASDAYATGQAVVALLQAGKLDRKHKSVRRAIDYLRSTQLADGSWLVKSRSKPFQKYFESGFPHKKNQWISICGSCWATMALIEARPPRR